MAKSKTETDKTQHQKFIETSRELGCDESETRFNATLKKIAKQEPAKKNGKAPVSPS